MAYSPRTGFIAVGGAEGKILLFDSSAKILSAHAQAHNTELLDLYFYDEQMQLISVSTERVIKVWDSLKLDCI